MLVFRIVLANYSNSLVASGRAARWNANDVKVIYTSSSQSLSCLENVVHRSKLGLSANFCVLTIEIPDFVKMENVHVENLSKNWQDFENMYLTQEVGNNWIERNKTAVLRVPSSIVNEEYNYLLNVNHPDFSNIKLLKVKPFFFDERIKQ